MRLRAGVSEEEVTPGSVVTRAVAATTAWRRHVAELESRGIFVDWTPYPHYDLRDRWSRLVDVMGRPMEIRNGVLEHVTDPIEPVTCPG
jgi:hypothetical protein